jgi:predicted RNA binding protein YcfA (HicA-like mRNA interferase family)
MSGKELVRLLEQDGWAVGRIKGSHHIMVKPGRRAVPVPVHGNRDLPPGTVQRILREAGLR